MRLKLLLLITPALVLSGFLCSCGDTEDEERVLPGSGHSGSNYNGLVPSRPWDPGNKQYGGGYGYGYGNGYNSSGSQPSEIQVNCFVDPCVFGTCIADSNNSTHCQCETGYTGRLCSECAEGYHLQGGLCIEDEACSNIHCAFGKCIVIDDTATCNCYTGYTGMLCDKCDTEKGYYAVNGRCVEK